MAKRKKSSGRKSGGRRRRMSGASKETLKMFGGIMVGVIGGTMLAQKVAPTMDQKVKGAILAAGGLFGATKVHGALMEGITMGLAVSGGVTVMKGFGVISGTSANRMIAGNLAMKQVNGGMVNGGMVNGGMRQLGRNQVNGGMVNGVSDAESMAYGLAASM